MRVRTLIPMRLPHVSRLCVPVVLLVTASASPALGQAARREPAAQAPFTTDLSLDQMKGKQAVLDTARGVIVIDLLPERAPNHVGYFIKLAREGAYDGTTFHRAVKYGIIQGGDPLSRDAARRESYGTGGLGVLAPEISDEKHTRGAVSAVVVPGRPNSAGAQFFICITDQPALDGAFSLFGRVVEGIEVAQQISEAAVDANGKIVDRIEIRSATIRDKPAQEPLPFLSTSVEDLATYRAVIETSMGEIALRFFPDRAPGHVRNFLRLAELGVFDATAFHRVVPGFVVQGGSLTTRTAPLTPRQKAAVGTLAPEFSDTKHLRGTLSMARGDDPASATTSFFIVLAPTPGLDGKYTVFGEVERGLEVVAAIEQVPVDAETPRTRIEVRRVRLEQGAR